MKGAFALVALAAVALASSANWETPSRADIAQLTHFKQGRQYRYVYNGQIATGVPHTSEHHAATRVQADVNLFFPAESNLAVMQINQIRMASLNKELPEPREVQPFGVFEQEETIEQEQLKVLRLPLRFRYENGMVSDLEFDGQEESWSANLKRAIVNMLQVNLQKVGRNDQAELARINIEERSEKSNERMEDFFVAQERTLEGNCETAYTMVEVPAMRSRQPSFTVTKTINFEKCQERADIRYGYRFGSRCPACEKKYGAEERNTESTTVFNFNITGNNAEQFLIREVEVRSQYVLAPMNEKAERMASYVSGRLELIAEQKKTVSEPKNVEKKESLLYSAEWDAQKELFHMEGETAFTKESPYTQIKNKPQTVHKLVQQLLQAMQDETKGVQLDATHILARIVKVIRMCSAEEIERIHNDVYEKTEHKKVRELLAESMALAGTKHSIQHLVEKIQKKQLQVTPLKGAMLLKALVGGRTISEKHIESVMSLCESDIALRHPELRQSCWLTAGAMMNGMCGQNDDQLALEYEQPERRLCPRSLKQNYVERVMRLFQSAETRYEKILALKTLANAGIDVSIVQLEKIIRDQREERAVRVAAIEALRLLRTQMPRKIQSLLLPIYRNKRVEPDVRAQAFHAVMQTLPERAVLEQLVAELAREPQRQLATFVYSQLTNLANSTNPCEKQLAHDITVVLRTVPEPVRRLFDSRFAHFTLYSNFYQTGASLNFAALFGNDSFLPKELTASLETVFAGQWSKQLLQVGVWQHNLDQLVVRILKELEDKKVEEVIVRGKRGASSSISIRPAELLRSIMQKLNIRGRRPEGVSAEPHAMLYMRYRDYDFAMLPIDSETIPQVMKAIIKNGRIELAEIERFLAQGLRLDSTAAGFFYESSRKIPTSIGFPLLASAKMPTVAAIEGQIKIEIEPKNGEKINGLKIRVNAKPTLASTHVTKFEIWSPIVNTGIKILHQAQINLPIDASVEIGLNQEQKLALKTVVKAVEQRKRIAELRTRPVAFIRSWPKNAQHYIETTSEKTVYGEQIEQRVQPLDSTWGEKPTGLKFTLRGHLHKQPFTPIRRDGPMPILMGENLIQLWVEPAAQQPSREFVLRVEASTFEQLPKMEQPAFENFFDYEFQKTPRQQQQQQLSKKQQQQQEDSSSYSEEDYNEYGRFFEVDSVEQEQMSEDERRTAFSTYFKGNKQLQQQQAYKQRVWMKLEATGSSVDRQAEAELAATCDRRMQHCRATLKLVRTPMFSGEQRNWQLKATAETLYPEQPETMQQLKEQQHREFVAQADCEWGTELQYNAHLRLQVQQNKAQKAWLSRVDKEIARRDIPAMVAFERLRDAAQLNHYKAVVQHQASPAVKNVAARLFHLLKSWKLWDTRIQMPEQPIPAGRIAFQLTVDPATRRYVNLTVETPNEITRMVDVLLPASLQPSTINIGRQTETPIRSAKHVFERLVAQENAECVVKSKKIQTFDDVIYRAPITTCYSVLAKDCWSEREQPRFAVLLKKLTKQGEEKKMKIIDEENVIEIYPENEKVIIKVNGKQEKNIEKLEQFNIYKIQEFVKVELDEVVVLFDGYTAKLRMSARMQNAQCGLCGHYDGEKTDELRRADNTLTDDLKEFHRSFLNRDEECKMEDNELEQPNLFELYSEEHPVYASMEEEDSNESLESSEESAELQTINKKTQKQWRNKQQTGDYEEESNERDQEQQLTKEPVMRTHVIEYNHRVCFSKEAVPECPRRTMAPENKTQEKKVKFACIERSQPEALKLTRLARQQVVDMSAYADAFLDVVKIPQLCVVY